MTQHTCDFLPRIIAIISALCVFFFPKYMSIFFSGVRLTPTYAKQRRIYFCAQLEPKYMRVEQRCVHAWVHNRSSYKRHWITPQQNWTNPFLGSQQPVLPWKEKEKIASIRGKKPHVYCVIILKQTADHWTLTVLNFFDTKLRWNAFCCNSSYRSY